MSKKSKKPSTKPSIALVELWYALLVIILAGLLFEHSKRFGMTGYSLAYWLRLMLVAIALILTLYIAKQFMLVPKRK